jgi:hypothetical protein
MSAKRLYFCLSIVILAGMILLLVMGAAPAGAQCEDPQPSSCTTCHAQEDPVNDKGEWHIIHASKDICINCHGGNGSTKDKVLAHEGIMAHPLDDIYTDCHSCHPDYDARAAQFAPILGVTPGSCATPTPAVVSNISVWPPPGNIVMPSDLMSTTPPPPPLLIISSGLAILAIFFIGLSWLARHHV